MTEQVVQSDEAPAVVDHGVTQPWSSTKSHAVFWSLAVSVCALDLWSKQAIFKHLHPNEVMDLIPGCLRFALALNDGAAFSIARGQTTLLVAISAVALVVVLGMFIFGQVRSRLMTVSLGLFAGGISGNFYDRAFNGGQVRDFIDAYVGNHHWPTFNVADSTLCIAVGLMMISAMRTPKEITDRGSQITDRGS